MPFEESTHEYRDYYHVDDSRVFMFLKIVNDSLQEYSTPILVVNILIPYVFISDIVNELT